MTTITQLPAKIKRLVRAFRGGDRPARWSTEDILTANLQAGYLKYRW